LTRPEVNFAFLNGKSVGKKNRTGKTIFDIHIRMPFRFNQANKKKSHIYTLTKQNKGSKQKGGGGGREKTVVTN